MDEQLQRSLEERSRMLFHDSVENLDMRVRSRLTQARHAALEAAAPGARARLKMWAPAAGVTAAAVLAAGLWMAMPFAHHAHAVSLADAQSNFEDVDMLATAEGSGDSMEMLQDDIDFYDFADKAAGSEPAA